MLQTSPFRISKFEFVSDFEIRISDFALSVFISVIRGSFLFHVSPSFSVVDFFGKFANLPELGRVFVGDDRIQQLLPAAPQFLRLPLWRARANTIDGRRKTMILFYTLALLLLGVAKLVIGWRAAALAKKYTRASAVVDRLTRDHILKDGNSNRQDLARAAKRYFELGRQVQKKERLEAKHYAWQARADRLGGWINRLRNWKGKKLPYTLGALDVWLLFYLIDYFGVGEYLSGRNVIELVQSWLK
jgi:hypothetical protein